MYTGFFVSFSPTHHHKSDALTVGKAGNNLQKSQTGVGMYILICLYFMSCHLLYITLTPPIFINMCRKISMFPVSDFDE